MGGPKRLALDWINKERVLVAHGDNYEWTDRTDPRVTEVRLMREIDRAGDGDNLLILGDGYDSMRALTYNPEYSREYRGKVKLVYIDPPFNTGQAFPDYPDALEHSVWLTLFRDRIRQIRDLLTPDGTVWVHLDNTEVHRARCVMDEEFGPTNYLATVIWQRTSAKSLARRTMATMHEQILVYGATERANLQPMYVPLSAEYSKRYTQSDERGIYDTGDLTAGSHRPHLDSGQPWRGFNPSDRRRCWAVPTKTLLTLGVTKEELRTMTQQEKLDALDKANLIHWPDKLNGFPRYKKYLDRSQGVAIGDLWTDINVINSQAGERTGFSTQKPEALLQRIIQLATNEGDIVLDCFAGSGTTAATAHKMRRRWITIEREKITLDTHILPRLDKVVAGTDGGGVTAAVEWTGGGGFRVLQVAPSMYIQYASRTLLADWVTGENFADAVCAQLDFERVDLEPFAGRRGNTLLAAVDGVADETVIEALVARLDQDKKLVVIAKSAPPDIESYLRKLSPGSIVRKAPSDLLQKRFVR